MDYKASGVDIDAGNEAVRRIRGLARSTFTPNVLSDIGSFGGLFRFTTGSFTDPVLVSSADGVGTKLRIAFLAGKHDTVGEDLVNHCVNDILVQGAEPLFFLDYFGTGRLSPAIAESVVTGMARACRENQCALLGGETAEMPGFYADGEYDIAGFIVGVVERARLITGSNIVSGDVLIGVPSTGLHTNGYSLARRIAFDHLKLTVDSFVPELGRTIGDALLEPHRSYLVSRTAAARDWPHQGHGSHHGRRHYREPAEDSSRGDGGADPHIVVDGSPVVFVVARERSRAGLRHDAHVQHGCRVDRCDDCRQGRRGQECARRLCHRGHRQRGASRHIFVRGGLASHSTRKVRRHFEPWPAQERVRRPDSLQRSRKESNVLRLC